MTETETKPMLSFPEAIKSCLRQYVGFAGRATRAEYWWWVLGIVVMHILLSTLDGIIFGFEPDSVRLLDPLFGLATLLPSLAVTARRLHDIGRTGWWQLAWIVLGILGVVPVMVGVVLALLGGISGDVSWAAAIGQALVGLVISLAIWIGLVVWHIWWLASQGQPGPNRHGADPRALTA